VFVNGLRGQFNKGRMGAGNNGPGSLPDEESAQSIQANVLRNAREVALNLGGKAALTQSKQKKLAAAQQPTYHPGDRSDGDRRGVGVGCGGGLVDS